MLPVGILGINFKTAELQLREAIARAVFPLSGERAIFFRHPIVVLSTCNRTEIYFSADDLAEAHSDLLGYLRTQIRESFEHKLYSYFGVDCFVHLCRVAAGLDSAIVAETEIQRQVRVAYAQARKLPHCLHYAFQKALKVSKALRSQLEGEGPTLYGTLWRLTEWKEKRILLVGYSEINRGLALFLMHKGVKDLSFCTRIPSLVRFKNIQVKDRRVLSEWQNYDVIVCASKADGYLIEGQSSRSHVIFDLSVPRNVHPSVQAKLYNIDQLTEQKRGTYPVGRSEAFVWEEVVKLSRLYRLKTQHVPENAEMELHL